MCHGLVWIQAVWGEQGRHFIVFFQATQSTTRVLGFSTVTKGLAGFHRRSYPLPPPPHTHTHAHTHIHTLQAGPVSQEEAGSQQSRPLGRLRELFMMPPHGQPSGEGRGGMQAPIAALLETAASAPPGRTFSSLPNVGTAGAGAGMGSDSTKAATQPEQGLVPFLQAKEATSLLQAAAGRSARRSSEAPIPSAPSAQGAMDVLRLPRPLTSQQQLRVRRLMGLPRTTSVSGSSTPGGPGHSAHTAFPVPCSSYFVATLYYGVHCSGVVVLLCSLPCCCAPTLCCNPPPRRALWPFRQAAASAEPHHVCLLWAWRG